MGRLGKKRGTAKRGRRPVVWFFVCRICDWESDLAAKRRPTGEPDDIPHPTCPADPDGSHGYMENQGLFFLTFNPLTHRKTREAAGAIRKEWARQRERMLRGALCECGHWRLDHRPQPPHRCALCACEEFRPRVRQQLELGHDADVPF